MVCFSIGDRTVDSLTAAQSELLPWAHSVKSVKPADKNCEFMGSPPQGSPLVGLPCISNLYSFFSRAGVAK